MEMPKYEIDPKSSREDLLNAFDNVDKATGLITLNRANHLMLIQSLELIRKALFGGVNAKTPSRDIPSTHCEGGDVGRSNEPSSLSKRSTRSRSLQS